MAGAPGQPGAHGRRERVEGSGWVSGDSVNEDQAKLLALFQSTALQAHRVHLAANALNALIQIHPDWQPEALAADAAGYADDALRALGLMR